MIPETTDPDADRASAEIDWIALERCGRAAAMARLGHGLLGLGGWLAARLAMLAQRGQPLPR